MSILHLISKDGFISVNKVLINKVGLESAVILGELCSEFEYYRSRDLLTEDGYFFSTVENIEKKTTIKEKRQRLFMNELIEMGIISVSKRGLPSKRHIKINEEVLIKFISVPNKFGQNDGTVPVKKTELEPSNQPTNNNINNNNINNNKKTPSPKFSTFDMQASKFLLKRIRDNNPDHKEPKLESWANTFRLIREKDKRTEEQIMYLIDWVQNDNFWKSNVLSPSNLREKWDRLVMKIKSNNEKSFNNKNKFMEALNEEGRSSSFIDNDTRFLSI